MQGKPFALIGVNSDPLARARSAVEKNKLNWRSFQDQPAGSPAKISAQWEVQGWPTLVVLDHEMRIRYRGHSGDAATDMVKELLAKVPAGGK